MKKEFLYCIIMMFGLFAFSQSTTHRTTTTKKTVKTTKPSSKKTKTSKLPPGVVVWTVDAQRGKCEGAVTMQCLLVREQGKKAFELFYDTIQGFDYKEGYVYTIWVKRTAKTPPIATNTSVYNYALVKVVSKKEIPGFSNTFTEDKKPVNGSMEARTKKLVVNEEKAPCSGIADKKCLLVREEGKKAFELLYQDIEGFTFEPGYRQTIVVTERYVSNPAVKEAQPVYTLVSVLNKERVGVPNPVTYATPPVTTPGLTTLDKRWFLKKMKDSDTTSYSIVDNAVWLEFNSAETRFTGKAPCNDYFGGFKSDLISSFQASAITSTKVYCSNMALENIYFTLLQNANNYLLKDGRLILSMGDRVLLEYE